MVKTMRNKEAYLGIKGNHQKKDGLSKGTHKIHHVTTTTSYESRKYTGFYKRTEEKTFYRSGQHLKIQPTNQTKIMKFLRGERRPKVTKTICTTTRMVKKRHVLYRRRSLIKILQKKK